MELAQRQLFKILLNQNLEVATGHSKNEEGKQSRGNPLVLSKKDLNAAKEGLFQHHNYRWWRTKVVVSRKCADGMTRATAANSFANACRCLAQKK